MVVVPEDQCSTPCAGDRSEQTMCGAADRMNIYQNPEKAEMKRQRNRAVVWRNGNAVEDADGFGLKDDYADVICREEVGIQPGQRGYMWRLLPCLLNKVKSVEIGKKVGFKMKVRSNFDGSVTTEKEGSFCVVEVEVVDFGERDTADTFTDCYCLMVTGKPIQLSEVTPKPPASAINACKQLKKFEGSPAAAATATGAAAGSRGEITEYRKRELRKRLNMYL